MAPEIAKRKRTGCWPDTGATGTLCAMWRHMFALGMLFVAGCGEAVAPPRLLLLITVDTLRADHLGAYGDTRGEGRLGRAVV